VDKQGFFSNELVKENVGADVLRSPDAFTLMDIGASRGVLEGSARISVDRACPEPVEGIVILIQPLIQQCLFDNGRIL